MGRRQQQWSRHAGGSSGRRAHPLSSSAVVLGCSLLLLLQLLVTPAGALFSWPGTKKEASSQDKVQEDAAAFFHASLPENVCVRLVQAGAHSAYAYPANSPIEDRHVLLDEQRRGSAFQAPDDDSRAEAGAGDADGQASSKRPPPSMLHAAVFDGHGGFEVAERVHKALVPKVKETLLALPGHLLVDERVVTNALVHAFVAVEQEWIAHVEALPDHAARVKKSTVGACALYALIMHSTLYVANAGDCRAVLGRRSTKGMADEGEEEDGDTDSESGSTDGDGEAEGEEEVYEALPLSFDHNSREEREQERLKAEHPGEEADIVKCFHDGRACYVKGRLQPVRAFGDLHLKLEEFAPPPGAGITWTPPYVTVIPEVVSARLNRLDDFLVLASDGLWDNFSNGEVVGMVAKLRKEGLSAEETAEALIEAALARVAQDLRVTVEQVKALRPGRERRGRHDDITVVVLFFEEQRIGKCPKPGTPEYEAELEEDEDDLRIIDGTEDEEEDEMDEDFDEDEDEFDEDAWEEEEGIWIEEEEWGDEDEEEDGDWDEDVDIDFMEEL